MAKPNSIPLSWDIEDRQFGYFDLYHSAVDGIFNETNYPVQIFYTQEFLLAEQWLCEHINDESTTTKLNTELLQQRIIGFDKENKVVFRRGEETFTCLIQVCVAFQDPSCVGHFIPKVLLFHCRQSKVLPPTLIRILESSWYLKCGVGMHGLGGDCGGMNRDFGINMRGMIELQEFTNLGLKHSITKCFPGVDAPKYKSITTSNWERSQLSHKQLMYSSLDAVYGYALGLYYIIGQRIAFNAEEDTLTMLRRCLAEKKLKKQAKRSQKSRYAKGRNRKKRSQHKDGDATSGSCSLLVKNLPQNMNNQTLLQLFRKYGWIKRHAMRRNESRGKVAVIEYGNSYHAGLAHQEMNGTVVGGNKLIIFFLHSRNGTTHTIQKSDPTVETGKLETNI